MLVVIVMSFIQVPPLMGLAINMPVFVMGFILFMPMVPVGIMPDTPVRPVAVDRATLGKHRCSQTA